MTCRTNTFVEGVASLYPLSQAAGKAFQIGVTGNVEVCIQIPAVIAGLVCAVHNNIRREILDHFECLLGRRTAHRPGDMTLKVSSFVIHHQQLEVLTAVDFGL